MTMQSWLKNVLKVFALLLAGFLLGVMLLYALLSYEHSRAGRYLTTPAPYVVPKPANELVEI